MPARLAEPRLGTLDILHDFVRRDPHLFVLTGAGNSTASGIPDYRDANDQRRGRAPILLHDCVSSEHARRRYRARSMVGWKTPFAATGAPLASAKILAAPHPEAECERIVATPSDKRKILMPDPNFRRAALALCATLFTTLAGAEGATTAQYKSCMDAAGGVTMNMIGCVKAETRRQDARLNHNYQGALKKLSPERRQKLRVTQRAWLAYRQAATDFADDPDGGTLARVSANQLFMQMTAERADALGRIASGD